MNQMEQLKRTFLKDLEGVSTLQGLEDLRVKALGKKGDLTLLMKDLGQKTPEERRTLGAELNALKDVLTTALEERKEILEEDSLKERLASETLDVTLPPRPRTTGNIHPLSHVMNQAIHIFGQMGFVVAEGPDIEEDFYNFTALNFPPDHPARQEQDTFYLPSSSTGQPLVLRTHTSPVQIRTMLKTQPPIRIIAPGRTYRSDYDATHTPMFHQIEGLVIDKHTHMGHLKGCLEEFCRLFFEDPSLKLRFRPGYFPFTEPSFEVDISCIVCSQKGCSVCKKTGWLELAGAGMVHPNVFKNAGYIPRDVRGFAFGIGLDRLVMMKYKIPDIRLLRSGDLQFLNSFST